MIENESGPLTPRKTSQIEHLSRSPDADQSSDGPSGLTPRKQKPSKSLAEELDLDWRPRFWFFLPIYEFWPDDLVFFCFPMCLKVLPIIEINQDSTFNYVLISGSFSWCYKFFPKQFQSPWRTHSMVLFSQRVRGPDSGHSKYELLKYKALFLSNDARQ